ncbi:hypothetical protein MAR_004071 [Mya arenaria]|uniref:Uncharacterized protein n=1 Tax=Mya arenaria TaxID=6604 RepID=A0ABY7EYQ8_MYAAR|nr:hypothetical protein MAR_004071 [Mya arenaria]
MYQSGHIWGQIVLKNPPLPSPLEWGWTKQNDKWTPLWSTIAEARDCSRRCKCQKANLPYTQLCYCDARCEGDLAD